MEIIKNRLFLAIALAVGLLVSSTPTFSMDWIKRTGSWVGGKYSAGKEWAFGKSAGEKPEEVRQEEKKELPASVVESFEVEQQKKEELERVAREKEAREKIEQQKRIEDLVRQKQEMVQRRLQQESMLRGQEQEEQELQRVLEASKKEEEDRLRLKQIQEEAALKRDLERVRQAEEQGAREKLEKERQEQVRRMQQQSLPAMQSPFGPAVESEEEALRLVEQLKKQQQQEQLIQFPMKNIVVGNDQINAYTSTYNGKEFVQLPVKNQFDLDGGGSASCGYHALNNGIEVALAVLKAGRRVLSLRERLFEPGVAATFTTQEGSWRQIIVKERALKKFQGDLKKLWEKAIRKELPRIDFLLPEKVKSVYSGAILNLADSTAKYIFEGAPIDQSMLAGELSDYASRVVEAKSDSDVREYYYKNPGQENLKNYLARVVPDHDTMNKFVDVSKLTLLPRPEINQNDYEWLDGDEIGKLVAYDKAGARLQARYVDDHVSVLVYEDTSLMGSRGFDANFDALQAAVRKSVTDPEHVVIFCVGTMRNATIEGAPVGRGHWFTVVWTKDRVYLMDSANNTLRFEDENVKNILNKFEQMLKKK